ncbi:MAG: trans-sulfuration enzyme family protein [Myxococcota bacterium]
MPDELGFSTRSIHVHPTEPQIPSEAIAPPIVQTSAFAFQNVAELDAVVGDSSKGFAYSRLTNPTVGLLERTVADLEGAEEAVAFASGMAAIHGVLTSLMVGGDHMVAPASVYGGAHALFTHVLPRANLSTTFVPTGNLRAMDEAMTPRTKVLYLETITNPTLEVADIAAAAEVAHRHDAVLVVDSTLASPALCRPIEHGADIVIHSASKYLGGHGDLIAGLAVGRKEQMRFLRKALLLTGGCTSPFVAWLILRGIKTLDLRMERHCRNAQAVAAALFGHPRVESVRFPGLRQHPDHDRAQALLGERCGGMVSFVVEGGHDAAVQVMDRLRLFRRAGSLGDAHSLVMIPALASHRSFSPQERLDAGIPDGFVRLSVGLEDASDLVADLRSALDHP